MTPNPRPAIALSKGFSGMIGLCLVAIGGLITLIGSLRYRRIEMQLPNQIFYP
jgi:hypothetical protein